MRVFSSSAARAAAAILALSGVLAATPALAAHTDGVSPGWKLCRASDPDQRIEGCTQVIAGAAKETKHNQLAAYVNRAGAYQAKGDYARAIEDYGRALEVEPGSAVVLLARGGAEHLKGDLDAALADYDQAIA